MEKNLEIEKDAANRWRKISMFLYSLAFLWVSANSIYVSMLGTNLIWQAIIIITPASIIITMARYASNESKLHRMHGHHLQWHILGTKIKDN